MECMNQTNLLESITQPKYLNEATPREAVKQVETLNKSFRNAFRDTIGGQKVVCVWRKVAPWQFTQPQNIYLYLIDIVETASVSGATSS